ncbi:MAG: SpoIIIAH-like family protein [Eubacteriales bacterium]
MNDNTNILDELGEITVTEEKPSKKKKFITFASKLKHKNVIIAASIVLVGGAVALNWILFSNGTAADDYSAYIPGDITSGDSVGISQFTSAGDDLSAGGADGAAVEYEDEYFQTAQINRQRARDEAMEVLSTIIDSEDAAAEARDSAAVDMAVIASNIESEANIETLITSKGFKECVAVVNSTSANIIVRSEALLPADIAQIKEIVFEQTGITPDAVKIINKE